MIYATALLLSPTVSFAGSYGNVTHDLQPKNFMEYEHREPCQYYKVVPQALTGYDRCVVVQEDAVAPNTTIKLLPVIATYTMYFDFDKSNIRNDQNDVLNKLVSELNTYHPTQVTVVGHTDTSGDATYNQGLSNRRADTVSKALAARNISSFYLDEHAFGEEYLAVPTQDGVRLEENRRVVIQFRR